VKPTRFPTRPARRTAATVAGLGLVLCLPVACTDEDPAGVAGASAPGAQSTPSTSSSAAAGPAAGSTASPASTAPITLAFGGDVHFTTHLTALLDDPETALASLRPYLATADVAMVNLETAITERGTPAPKQFHFRTTPAAVRALDAAGVDVASLANNHAVDYGRVGLRDSLAARDRSPIPLVGLGRDAGQAYAPAYLPVRGSTVAVLAATQVPDWTLATWPAGADRPGVASASSGPGLARLVRSVRAAARRADVVVVYLHWGTDYLSCPNSLQRDTARALSRAGADVVLGTHAHRVQGAGWLGRTYVGYGLGNFVWWRRNSEADARSGVLTLTVQPSSGRVSQAKWTPMLVTASGVPARQRGADGRRLLAAWNDARDCTGLSATPR
jgi:hypothetical protein